MMTTETTEQTPKLKDGSLGGTASSLERMTAPSGFTHFHEKFVTRNSRAKSLILNTGVSIFEEDAEEWEGLHDISNVEIPHLSPRADTTHRGTFISLQKWQGAVLEKRKNAFTARLVDLTAPDNEEEAEFSQNDVSQEDWELVMTGAIFYWSIGYFTDTADRRKVTSELRFRRLPSWSKEEFARAEKEAETIYSKLGYK